MLDKRPPPLRNWRRYCFELGVLKPALASEPMWIDPPAVALFHNFRALGDESQRRESQPQAQPLQRLRRTDEGGLPLEARRVVIQAVLFNVKS
jgi:hypothetical protein